MNLTMAERWRRQQLAPARARVEDAGEALRNPDGTQPPLDCPACRSRDLATTSKTVNTDAYWRCRGCGNVRNVGRHRAASRQARDLPFRH
jgi:transposase-like protein